MKSSGSMLCTAALFLVLSSGNALAFDWPWSKKEPPPPPPPPAFTDTSLPFEKRVDDLVSRLTLEEKASQLVNRSRAIPRLGIPAYNWWSEALHGVARNGLATAFPQAIALGATFDPPLIHDMTVAISKEARIKYNEAIAADSHNIYEGLTFWSPNINIFRDPRWGRGQETYGEDPYLTGRMGVAFVTGMQGGDPKYLRTIATPKHYAVHSGPESTRHTVDVAASLHDMEDTYLPAFRTAVVDGKAGSVMCAYNRVNGQPACASGFLLLDTLRQAWDFKGFVVSDCDAVLDIQEGHHYTKTFAEAGALSLKHGMDNECSEYNHPADDPADFQHFIDAVKEGLVPESVLDASLKRLFMARMKLGMFDPPEMVPFTKVSPSELDSPAHRALALKAARESMVLLKNNGMLPLKPSVKRILVTGPLADQTLPLLGNYNGTPSHIVSPLEGIKAQFPDAEIVYEPGTNFLRALEPIPVAVLTTPDGQPGLKAEYFGENFRGEPLLTRIDPGIEFSRVSGQMKLLPMPGVVPYTVRWTGVLTPEETGDYLMGLDASGSKLFLDGKTVVNLGADSENPAKTSLVHLVAGQKYTLKVEGAFSRGVPIKLAWMKQIPNAKQRMLAAARNADAVIAVVGITPALEGEEMVVDVPGFVGGDRTSLDLPKAEQDLLKAVKTANKPLAVVLMNGSALSVNWAARHADAILESWYGGQAGGTAVGEILSGAYNPAGRLPVTFYTGVKQLPPFEDYSMENRTYRYFTGKPLYSFGYGLSYTKFAYSGLTLSKDTVQAGDTLSVDVEVKNVGKRAGDEVAQLYIAFPKLPGAPIRALRGVERLHLLPGETKHVHFELGPRELSSVTEAGEIAVQPGDYALSVGGGPRGATKAITAKGFKIEGEMTLPR